MIIEDLMKDKNSTIYMLTQTITKKVRVGRNATDTANIFYIDDEAAPRLA